MHNLLSDSYKIKRGEGVPGRQTRARANFAIVAFEMRAEVRQNRQNIDIFFTNFPLRG